MRLGIPGYVFDFRVVPIPPLGLLCPIKVAARRVTLNNNLFIKLGTLVQRNGTESGGF